MTLNIDINSKEYKNAQAQWIKQTEELEKTEWYWIFKRIRRINEVDELSSLKRL